jgi:hypothetical protein
MGPGCHIVAGHSVRDHELELQSMLLHIKRASKAHIIPSKNGSIGKTDDNMKEAIAMRGQGTQSWLLAWRLSCTCTLKITYSGQGRTMLERHHNAGCCAIWDVHPDGTVIASALNTFAGNLSRLKPDLISPIHQRHRPWLSLDWMF